MSARNTSAEITAASSKRPAVRRGVVACVGGSALLATSLMVGSAAGAGATVRTDCVSSPHACGFPDATNSGVPAGTVLKAVPGKVTSGTGWSYEASDHTVNVTGNGAVLSGLSVTGSVNIKASDVTIKDDQVVTSGTWGSFAVAIRNTSNVTVENSTVRGLNATSGRVSYGISDVYGNSTGMVIKDNNISNWRIGVNVSSGQVTGNYIHSPGYIAGDHTDGVYDAAGTQQLTVSGNTIYNSRDQTDAVILQTSAGQTMSNKTIKNNLLAGGDYVIYGGDNATTSKIVITGNRFGQQYYAKSGSYGPVAYFQPSGKGNVWSGNVWDSTGKTAAS
jgi:hypothetical protein